MSKRKVVSLSSVTKTTCLIAFSMDYLRNERTPLLFEKSQMSAMIYGSSKIRDRFRLLARIVREERDFDRTDNIYLSREDLFRFSLKSSLRVIEKISEQPFTDDEIYSLTRFVDDPLPIGLSMGMFIPAIEGQGTPEQAKKWVPLAKSFSIIGCYAQTELGHGSNIQGLETEARYIQATDEFEIHSPTLTSTKWWPGGLGKASTHALVYARLLINSVDHGIHAFIVPIRSLESHEPLPGITVGDIGPKFGYNTMDNGFLRMSRVRIPRTNMLMKFASVSRDGKFSRSGNPKLSYGAMVLVRANLVKDAAFALSRAVTIAVRYSAVRRQFGEPGQQENQILDYSTQQHRLFPLLASAYAFHFVGTWMMSLYNSTMSRFRESDFSSLPEVHALTSGLKSLTTQTAADGIEECRRRCGGSGFLRASGLPDLYATYVPAVTYEGDNIVLMLQVARFLLKSVQAVVKTGAKLNGTVAYLNSWQDLMAASCPDSTAELDTLDAGFQLEALRVRAMKMALLCADRLSKCSDQAKGFQENTVLLVRAATAHCQLIVAEKFIEAVNGFEGESGVKLHLKLLSDLYSLHIMENNVGDFLEMEYFSPEHPQLVRDSVRKLCQQIRPAAVQLVDAFEFTDHFLNSVIGRFDGDVYTHLYASALKEPLNKRHVAAGMEFLRPYIGKHESSTDLNFARSKI